MNLTEKESFDRIKNVYMISDSSGETVSVVLRAVAAQLVGVKIEGHLYPLVKTVEQIDEILNKADENDGVILCTMSDESLFDYLVINAKKRSIACIEVLSKIIRDMARYFEAVIDRGARQTYIDSDYFERIGAINYALEHDDGQSLSTLQKADIILVGVSRSSKSPTSVYLANRGYRVANVPFVSNLENPLPDELLQIKNKPIVGLVIDAKRLLSIRKSRMKNMHSDLRMDYVDYQAVIDENKTAQVFYNRMGWGIIDVTERAVEETAAMVIQYYNKFISKKDV